MSRYRDWPKNPRRGVQMAPEHKRVFGAIRPIWHFWSAKRHSKRAEFCFGGLWPNGLRVMIRYTFFDLFAKGCIRIRILITRTYFLESSILYKYTLNLIIQHHFLHSERHTFQAPKQLIFFYLFSDFLLKLGFLDFKDN